MDSKVYIVSAGMVKVDRHYDKGIKELFVESLQSAVNDLRNINVDAIIVSNMCASTLCEQSLLGTLIADTLGLYEIPAIHIEAGQNSGGVAILVGYNFIKSGLYNSVLICGVEKLSDYPAKYTLPVVSASIEAEYEAYYGANYISLGALIMQSYMRKYRVSYDDISSWPIVMHEYGSKNPYAYLKFKITKDDVIHSPIVSKPLKLLDCAPLADGAATILLTNEEYARKFTDTPIELQCVVMCNDKLYLASREDITTFVSMRKATKLLQEKTQINMNHIDIIELHDVFSIFGFIELEDLGLVEKGKSVKEFNDGRFQLGDRPTVNPSGGLKARGDVCGATGIYQVAEIFLQLRGEFPGVKVNGEVGLAVNIGGIGSSVTLTLLRR